MDSFCYPYHVLYDSFHSWTIIDSLWNSRFPLCCLATPIPSSTRLIQNILIWTFPRCRSLFLSFTLLIDNCYLVVVHSLVIQQSLVSPLSYGILIARLRCYMTSVTNPQAAGGLPTSGKRSALHVTRRQPELICNCWWPNASLLSSTRYDCACPPVLPTQAFL